MVSKSDFTAEEWETLAEAVELAMGAAVLPGKGKYVVVSDLRVADFADHAVPYELRHDTFLRELNSEVEARHSEPQPLGKTRELYAQEADIWLRHAIHILAAKAPEEMPGYREYVLDMATAAGETTQDGVYGITAKGLSAMEAEAIEKLKDAMA